jgi:hypothetical protein
LFDNLLHEGRTVGPVIGTERDKPGTTVILAIDVPDAAVAVYAATRPDTTFPRHSDNPCRLASCANPGVLTTSKLQEL